ncbi:protein C1orf43 homolog isoform X1 [Pieris rapae]|uniref:protein C1orf43 homolog isoform X1 n=2 Tax=Pieris rapae TaxID=64459 RepID=UPI001E27BA13|nr:protein C1orf43 homolog isoform X1 [Pieris rapae]
MQDFTSILNIIFIISGGVLTFVILFIFAKRQITRFALRSRRGPHVPIGTDAKKCLKKEIERRIEAVPRIMLEPRLLCGDLSHYILEPQQPYHYRFRAVDDVKNLEEEIVCQDPNLRRHPRESLRAFLLSCLAAPLDGRGQKLIHQFCDAYESARHHPAEFGEEEYRSYNRLLLKLLDAARLLKSVGCVSGGSRGSPQRRPARLLDPTRLRPPLAHNNQYTALENLPVDSKIEEETIHVPIKSPTEPIVKPPADETAV